MLAQIPDVLVQALTEYGILGIILIWFVWREHKRADSDNDRQLRQESKIDALVSSMHDLTRAITIEVLTREHVQDRARAEASELLKRIDQ